MRPRVGNKEQLPSGSWRITIQSGLRDDGFPRRIRETVATEELADERLTELAIQLGRQPEYAQGITLSEYWEFYTQTKGKRIATVTFEKYESIMRLYWLPVLGDRDVTMIERKDLQAVILQADTNNKGRDRKRVISAVLGQAVTDGILRANPCASGGFEYPHDVGRKAAREVDYSDDPFAEIEGSADVWSVETILRAMPRLEGTSLETCWLLMVGAGLRREEALALKWSDVRRVEIAGSWFVQVAIYQSYTHKDGLHRTKTPKSTRVATVADPFGSRLWSLRGADDELVVKVSAANISRRWAKMWEPLSGSKHTPKSCDPLRGRMLTDPPIPFLPLGRMRATHATLMQDAGVLDSINAALHGHSQRISYKHYQRSTGASASKSISDLVSRGSSWEFVESAMR